jgi:hypothetical protein
MCLLVETGLGKAVGFISVVIIFFADKFPQLLIPFSVYM